MRLSPPAPSRTANAWAAAAAAVSVLFAVGLATAPVAAADTCDNATLRAQNNSTGLPDCRAYEMVTSRYKEGFNVDPTVDPRFTDDGVFGYSSLGKFAGTQDPASGGNRFHATRSAAGWVTTAVSMPGWIYDTLSEPVHIESADLRWSVWRVVKRFDVPGSGTGVYLLGVDGAIARVGDGSNASGWLGIAGGTPDLSHVIYSSVTSPLFEHVGTGNGLPRVVSINNNGQGNGSACFRSISPDGRVIAYTSQCAGNTPAGTTQVWARIGGSVSVLASGSECTRAADDPDGPCNAVSSATYAGGAKDGSRVFFTTSQQLVNGDVDQTSDLYACDIPNGVPAPVGAANPCDTLTQVSGTASGAQVVGVPIIVSEDGSRTYFVADGAALADNLGVNGAAPVAGDSNLYLWTKDPAHPAGEVRFVAKLDSNDLARVQTTPDGRYLLFLTASKLVTDGPGDDDDSQVDAYRYDAVTKTMVRVSTSVAGGGGNGLGFDVSMVANPVSSSRDGSRVTASMSADGSTVIFDTAEGLSTSDTNGVTDVYSWHDGHVSAISAGGGISVAVTPSGRDIFFTTIAPVVAADGDGLQDVYTARVGGGFAPARATPCAGDGCQGLLSGAPGLAAPRSGSSGDSDAGDGVAAVLSLRAVTATQRRRLAATGKLSLTILANAAGRVSATAKAKIAGRSVTVAAGRQTMTAPGSTAVTLKLSRKARRQLATRGRLTVKVVVSHSKASKGRSVTLKLRRARASRSSVGGRS